MSRALRRTRSTSSSSISSVPGLLRLITSRNPCADPREDGGCGCTDQEPLTGYEPNRIVDNPIINEQEDITCTEDNQITEIEGHGKSLSYKQSLLSSTQDSIESIAVPQETDLDDEQIRVLLASPRYLPEREASAERSQVYHSEREGLMSRSSQGLVELFSHHSRLNQDAFSERAIWRCFGEQ